MSSASATVSAPAMKAAAPRKSKKNVETQNVETAAAAPTTSQNPDFGSDVEDEAAQAAETAEAEISSFEDAISCFIQTEQAQEALVNYVRKIDASSLSKSEKTELVRHYKKLNTMITRLSDAIMMKLIQATPASKRGGGKGEKPSRESDSESEPRKKAEQKLLPIRDILSKILAKKDFMDALREKNSEFGTDYDTSNPQLTRTDILRAYSHFIATVREKNPEDMKSTVLRTKEDGTEVVDNTYYTVCGDAVKFYKELSNIIKAEMAKGDASKYSKNIEEMKTKGLIDDAGNIPKSISMKYHMSYLNFLIADETA